MASNSLRGGKNIYSSGSLMSNWFEERLEPHNQEVARMKSMALPTKSAKTWSTTSSGFGRECQEAMKKSYLSTETSNWLKYQKDGSDHYVTTAVSSFCHPEAQVPTHEAPYISEEKLVDYRDRWTRSDVRQFNRLDGPGKTGQSSSK
mmetsp:Transcript_26207/g.41664  ORF Transcript_26207/g.41664 Transcript_26207/m.41664 type:complete len:147 (+) Transcript_26207:63-503(+)